MVKVEDLRLRSLVAEHDAIAEGRKKASPEHLASLCEAVRRQIQYCGCEPEEDPPVEERRPVAYVYHGPNGPVTIDPADIEIIYPDT